MPHFPPLGVAILVRAHAVTIVVAALTGPDIAPAQLSDHAIVALDATTLRTELAAGRLSAERVTQAYLRRIAALDDAGPTLNAVIELNPEAEAIARRLDEGVRSGVVGPLHGVPVLVKASIDTADRMATSAGSLALAAHRATEDATVVERLRAAGAVLLGKTNLSEWANFRSTDSTSGWSSLGGQTRNPYVLDRNPCGSSSGAAVAVAARLAPLSIGTETDGSIVCPAAANGVVGIKPTIGTVSRRGIVPIARSQDTAGPLARTVADATLLLSVLVEPPHVAAPAAAPAAAIAGLRIGVVRDFLGSGDHDDVEASFAATLRRLTADGAVLIDPVNAALGPAVARAELAILLAEFRDEIDVYLAGVQNGPRTLEQLIMFNAMRAPEVMPHFGQELFIAARAIGGTRSAEYRAAQARAMAARAAVAALFAHHRLDALIAPANARAWPTDYATGDALDVSSSRIAAVTGFPSIAVPTDLVTELPLAVSVIGLPQHEAKLFTVAAAIERARGPFPAPRFLTSVSD
jgi:amidase